MNKLALPLFIYGGYYMSSVDVMKNKEEFINLVNSIQREGFYKDKLLYKLEQSDFYTAPASTVYHSSCEGGLVQHTLNVYKQLVNLIKSNNITNYSEDTIKLVSLFHDLSKMNFYETYVRNVKKYSDRGSKSDDMGKFDWASERGYKVKEPTDRFLFGSHGQNSERILSYYVPLSEEESAAIIWHHAGMDNNNVERDLTPIMNRYPLVVLLHLSDMYAAYIDERVLDKVVTF